MRRMHNSAPPFTSLPVIITNTEEDPMDPTVSAVATAPKLSNFETFCNCTSLHGWKYLALRRQQKQSDVNRTLQVGWVCVVLASMSVAGFFLGYSFNDFVSSTVQTTQDTSRASLDNVFFPSVTLCNINQGRRSFFLEQGLHHGDSGTLLHTVLGQAYFGSKDNLTADQMASVKALFSSEEVLRKGVLTDMMYTRTTSKDAARRLVAEEEDAWEASKDEDFVAEAGWYFKTLAAQEPGENNVLLASYGKTFKDTERFTDFLPFFGTDYGLCSLIKPQIAFDSSLADLPFETLMKNYSSGIRPGIQLGKENGLTLLLDAEVYDYAFSPQRGEGFKLAIHSHMDQPIMALSDIDLSPGFVTQLSVTPTLRDTTEAARRRFSPEERGCYFDGEMEFKYLPSSLYRYGLSNCLFAATYDQILSTCECVPFFHTLAWNDYPRICSGPSLLCMNSVLRDIGSHTHVKQHDPSTGEVIWRPCLFACKDQSYTTAVTTSTFPNLHTFLRGPEFCLMLRKLRSSCTTSKNITLEEQYPDMCSLLALFPELCLKTNLEPKSEALVSLLHRYARENLLLANIYIKDPAVTLIKRDQKIPVIWFVANVGGILGLCMGCSLVTLFEVMHHVLLVFLETGKRSVVKLQKTIRSGTSSPVAVMEAAAAAERCMVTSTTRLCRNGSSLVIVQQQQQQQQRAVAVRRKRGERRTSM